MNFTFHSARATEAACAFLQRSGGSLHIMKLMKLMYLLDRLSIDRRNCPVIGGDYLSMRNGPVISELLDLINGGRLNGEQEGLWAACISDRADHEVRLEQVPPREFISDAELKLIDEIWAEHGPRHQWELVDWCHRHCGEWTPLARGCAPIAVERMGQALGKSPDDVQRLAREAAELNMLDEIFAPV